MNALKNEQSTMEPVLTGTFIPLHHILLITAAASTVIGEVRIKSIQPVTQAGSSWARVGRSIQHGNFPTR